ncbi:bcl-2-like protein 11 isoform X2 [Lepisosteus oculatus]|uniref:bcl-2-like protein 11 isoform X2 n=1 Tax=Lepisosteus oculatus TaxID=7918 RepID=UPI00074038AB|nr:PREDICTED: bcl-2-like protein 11 isoform X2 [Lepisosteus oculatus]
MSYSPRGQKQANGSTTLDCERGEGGELRPGPGAGFPPSGAPAPPNALPSRSEGSRSPEVDHLRGGITMPHSPLSFATRFPVFRPLHRSSSGYFSFDSDSLPSSPPMSHNKSTQTPSPSSQAIAHAQQRISQEQETSQNHDMPQSPHRPYRPRSLSMPADMRPEVWVAQELRRIGDEFNSLYLERADTGGVRKDNGLIQLSEAHY